MRRAAAAALAVALLGASCTEESEPPPEASAAETPRCEALPGRGPEGFALRRSREIDEADRVAIRLEYRDPQGRRLVYLLGLSGAIGEGLPVLGTTTLPTGQEAQFLGRGEAWMLVWEDAFPCPHMAVVGNGFDRPGFVRLVVGMGLVRPSETAALLGEALTEWVAVFHTARDLEELDDDTEALIEVAPRALVVGPVGCHAGLADALGVHEADTYFSGLAAPNRRALDRAVVRAVRHPLFRDGPTFIGELTVRCLAD